MCGLSDRRDEIKAAVEGAKKRASECFDEAVKWETILKSGGKYEDISDSYSRNRNAFERNLRATHPWIGSEALKRMETSFMYSLSR
jgi:hypothetical protein